MLKVSVQCFESIFVECELDQNTWNFRAKVTQCKIKVLSKCAPLTFGDLKWQHGTTILKAWIAQRESKASMEEGVQVLEKVLYI